MRVRVTAESVKWDGARHGPGSILDVSFDVAARWLRHSQAEYIDSPPEEVVVSHSDLAIEHANVLIEEIPGLTAQQAQAIVAAGYELASLPDTEADLVAIRGIGPATAAHIMKAQTAKGNPDGGDTTTD